MLFYSQWSRISMVLAVLLCLVTMGLVSTPSAYAAGVPLTTTTTTTKLSVIKASAQLCAALQKSRPAQAGDAHLCDITIVATESITRRTGMQSASFAPHACYPVVNHSALYQTGWPYVLAEFSQSETFTYGCSAAPQISNHWCSGLWTDWKYHSLHQSSCFQYPNGYGHTQAEDDVIFDHHTLKGYTDGQPDASIYDWCQC